MTIAPGAAEIDLRRLFWVGPTTVAVAVLAVVSVQTIGVATLGPLPRFSHAVLHSNEPAMVTTVLVAAAVFTFAAMGSASAHPLRTFSRLALVVLLLSFIPNVVMALSGAGWAPMGVLMVMHIVVWFVTVTMLTRLCVRAPTT